MNAVSERRDVVVVGGGQAGLAHRLPARPAGPELHDPRRGRHARGGVARALGLAAAVHPRALRQPARARLPRRPDHYPAATTSSPTSPTTPASSSCPSSWTAASEPYARRTTATWSRLADRTYEADQVVIATGPFQSPRVPEMPSAWTRTSSGSTAARTADPGTCRPGRCSSSVAATPASRSPRSSRARTRCTCRSARGRRRCHSAPRPRPVPLPRGHGLMGKTVTSRLGRRHAAARRADRVEPADGTAPARHPVCAAAPST